MPSRSVQIGMRGYAPRAITRPAEPASIPVTADRSLLRPGPAMWPRATRAHSQRSESAGVGVIVLVVPSSGPVFYRCRSAARSSS